MIADSELIEVLGGFVVRHPGDDIADYLLLVHEPCGGVVCQVEPGDLLSVLAMTAQAHLTVPCPVAAA